MLLRFYAPEGLMVGNIEKILLYLSVELKHDGVKIQLYIIITRDIIIINRI